MPRPRAHYSLLLRNHHTGERLRLELIESAQIGDRQVVERTNIETSAFRDEQEFSRPGSPREIISVQVLRLRVTVSVR
jgi:hypothetical protein